MKTEKINLENWASFTDDFSREHKKKLFNIEAMESSGEKRIIAENLKLKELSVNMEEGENNNTTYIIGEAEDREVTHTVVKTNHISLEKNEYGGETAIYIGSETDGTIVLNFRPVPSQKNIFS